MSKLFVVSCSVWSLIHSYVDGKPYKAFFAELQDANDTTVTYVARLLPHLASCSLDQISINAKGDWSASRRVWHAVDDAIMECSNSILPRRIYLGLGRHDVVPTWEVLPVSCLDKFCKQMLPRCSAKGKLHRCTRQDCKLHDPERGTLQTQGSLQYLLEVLPNWTFPVKQWTITVQSEQLANLEEVSQEIWTEITRIFRLSFDAYCHTVKIDILVEDVGLVALYWTKSAFPTHPYSALVTNWPLRAEKEIQSQYPSMFAVLKNADDHAITYLALIVPCMAICDLVAVNIFVKDGWSASRSSWYTLDEALLTLSTTTASLTSVRVRVHKGSATPAWKALPYECMDGFYAQMLPNCTAKELVPVCRGEKCELHDTDRWCLEAQGDVQELLRVLCTWTCPAKLWYINIDTTPLESLSVLSHDTWKVWEEISRIFRLSAPDWRPTCYVSVESMGILTLSVTEGKLLPRYD